MIRAFLGRLRSAGISLREVTLAQIDEALLKRITSKGYKRTTVKDHASNLRAFFRYAEGAAGAARAWRRASRLLGSSPRSHPAGPTWDEVRRCSP